MSHPMFPKSYISKVICLAVLIAMVLGLQGFAQVAPTGTISGLVSDASGASIVNAQVKATNTDTNVTRTATTGSSGGYRFSALPIGRYDVTVTMAGFKTETEKSVILDVGQEAIENFNLAIGAVGQEVVVTAEHAQVDTTSSSLGSLVDSRQIADLPLNGRNFIDLTLLQTGITQFSNNIFGTFGLFGELFSSNGAPLRSNMYTLDGAIMGNIVAASASSIDSESLGLDGIAQYKTMTNSYEAQYGLVMGSQTTIVTKSGTNRFHGDAFEYLRNSVLDARSYFDDLYTLPTSSPGGGDRIAPFRRNQFGGAIGGPIKPDKLFFFATYEGFRELSDNPPTVGITPTIPAACHTPVVGGVETVTNACDSTLQPGQTENVDPVIQPILALWPLPNIPGNQFGYLSTNTIHEDYIQGRIDDTMSDTDSIFGRYTYDNTNEIYPTVFPQFNDGLVERQQYLTLAERHIFSARLVNSGSFSFSRSRVFDSTPASLNPATALIGPQYSCISGNPICAISLPNIPNFGFTTEAIANVQGIFTVGDDAFWTKGKHEIKFGALFNHYNQYGNQGVGPDGALDFASLQGFLLGDYESYKTYTTQGYNSLKDMLFATLGSYVQDTYHIQRRLNLNLGLRYEFATQPNEKNGRQSYFVDPPYSDNYALGPIVGDPTYKDFSPRLGFGWDVFGNGSTSVKGGAAILYDLTDSGEVFELEGVSMPPYVSGYTVTPETAGAPATVQFPLPLPSGASAGSLKGTSPVSINRNYKTPRMYDFNLAIERKLPLDTVLSVAYAGSRGVHLWQPAQEANPRCPTSNTFVPQGCAGITSVASGTTVWSNASAPRLNPFWGDFSLFNTYGESWYNALEVNLTNRLSHGLQYHVAYTYSKLLDDTEGIDNADTSGSAPGRPEDPFNLKLDWGPANFDVKSNLHASIMYHFPKAGGNGVVGHMLSGWWTGNIISTETGVPFSPLITTDREQAGLTGAGAGLERVAYVTNANVATLKVEALAAGITTCPANSSGCIPYNPVVYNPKTVITHNINQWFNPNMFALQPVGTVGDVSRNTLREPGLTQWDISLNKDTAWAKLGEGGAIQFRAEVFNVLNHPGFGPAGNAVFAGSKGDAVEQPNPTNITSQSNSSRQIQFSIRALF
jgi:hypothetical protein